MVNGRNWNSLLLPPCDGLGCHRCCSCWHGHVLWLLVLTCVLHMLLGDGDARCRQSRRRSCRCRGHL